MLQLSKRSLYEGLTYGQVAPVETMAIQERLLTASNWTQWEHPCGRGLAHESSIEYQLGRDSIQ